MNEHYIRQRGSLQEKEAAERMIASINSLLQTTGSAECVLIRKCSGRTGKEKGPTVETVKESLREPCITMSLKINVMLKRKLS